MEVWARSLVGRVRRSSWGEEGNPAKESPDGQQVEHSVWADVGCTPPLFFLQGAAAETWRECGKIAEAWMTGAEGERTPDKAGPHPRGPAIFHKWLYDFCPPFTSSYLNALLQENVAGTLRTCSHLIKQVNEFVSRQSCLFNYG